MTQNLHSINTLLVANRGEIAVRVIATAKKCGIRTVAVYSQADANAMHVEKADVSICIGAASASDSYLNIEAIINAALSSGADAIHPGYGFLSENPDLVDACDNAGIIFVGPSAAAMRSMGLKDAAKALMEKAGVPVVPGYHGDNQDAEFLAQQANTIGYPVLIKARAGGGGKGMRRVDRAEQFGASLQSAQREAQASFGDAAVLIEKYIEHPRHIEVQVFGDTHGNCVHLFERDCSLQRRHQKVIEEAPAPWMTQALRDAMTTAAVRAAKSIDYVGAGTVEFIVDASGPLRADGFWFMEMNTRLQVEHPVTEAVTGFDLVEWQLAVAAGQRLPVAQEQIMLNGHAVEARLYAEDVEAGFLPATGTLHRLELDKDDIGLVHSGVREGDEVQPFYDPMLAKLIAHGPDRVSAFGLLHRMLDNATVMGTTTNRAFLALLCAHKDVLAGNVHTGLIEQQFKSSEQPLAKDDGVELDELLCLAAVVTANAQADDDHKTSADQSVHSQLGLWQLWGTAQRRVELKLKQQDFTLRVNRQQQAWEVTIESVDKVDVAAPKTLRLQVKELCALEYGTTIDINGQSKLATALSRQGSVFCRVGRREAQIQSTSEHHLSGALGAGDAIVAPMPGRIIALNCEPGATVRAGDVLITLEAMKMEHSLTASADATVASVSVAVDDQVEQGKPLIVFAS